MAIAAVPRHRRFEHIDRLGRTGAVSDVARLQVPKRPGRPVHDRFREQRRNVGIVAEVLVHPAHGMRKSVVPGFHVVARCRLRITCWQGVDQRLLDRCCTSGEAFGIRGRLVGGSYRLGGVRPVEGLPGLVVIGTNGIGDAPMGHGAGRVVFQRLLETLDGQFVIVGVGPHQPPVEPSLGLRRLRRDLARIAAYVEIIHDLPPQLNRIDRTERATR